MWSPRFPEIGEHRVGLGFDGGGGRLPVGFCGTFDAFGGQLDLGQLGQIRARLGERLVGGSPGRS